MLYLLINQRKQANWQQDFEDNLEMGLRDCGLADCIRLNSLSGLKNLNREDYVFVMHHDDLDAPEVRLTKARIICHQHGTAVNPFTPVTDRVKELDQFYNVIDVCTFHSPTAMKLTKKRYPFIHNAVMIGTPKHFQKYIPWVKPKKKKIVIAGDMWPHKQFYLSAFLLKDLVDDYEIVFSFMNREYEGSAGKIDWAKYYDLERFVDMGFFIRFNPHPFDFYEELGNASHYFTASVGDVISTSAIEAQLCGCYVVVPEIYNYWPCFMDYISAGYRPFDKEDVERVILKQPKYIFNTDLFEPKKVAERLLKGLHYEIS